MTDDDRRRAAQTVLEIPQSIGKALEKNERAQK